MYENPEACSPKLHEMQFPRFAQRLSYAKPLCFFRAVGVKPAAVSPPAMPNRCVSSGPSVWNLRLSPLSYAEPLCFFA